LVYWDPPLRRGQLLALALRSFFGPRLLVALRLGRGLRFGAVLRLVLRGLDVRVRRGFLFRSLHRCLLLLVRRELAELGVQQLAQVAQRNEHITHVCRRWPDRVLQVILREGRRAGIRSPQLLHVRQDG
jgi:hypothetical protein